MLANRIFVGLSNEFLEIKKICIKIKNVIKLICLCFFFFRLKNKTGIQSLEIHLVITFSNHCKHNKSKDKSNPSKISKK